jgi:uncharacterized protein (DUF362 family)/ferredoxin
MNTTVTITRFEKNIDHAVKKAIELAGGLETIVEKGEKIFLKPNFVGPRESSYGATTDLEVIRVVAEEVRRCGGIPVLYETSAVEFDTESVYHILGIRDFARQNEIRLVEEPVEMMRVPIPGGKVIKTITIPRFLHRAKIINLPKLKTHILATMSCAMKNLIELLPPSEKKRLHVHELHASIFDISRVFQPVFTIVDAINCMEGDGPTYGDKVNLGLIVAGKDMRAVDMICSQIIGLSWKEIKYLNIANENLTANRIKVVGESISDVQTQFRIPQRSLMIHLGSKLMYSFDMAFTKIFSRPLLQLLYSTGYMGTNPKILKQKCDKCLDCLEACPVEGALKIDSYAVDYKKCLRCLYCVYACNKNAIDVKGFTHPADLRKS